MASPQPPYRPQNPNALAGNMQNLQIGSRPQPPSARPPPFGSNGPIPGVRPPGPGSAPIAQSPFSAGGPSGPQRPGGPQLGSQRPVGAPQMNPVGFRSVGPPPGSQPQFSSGPQPGPPPGAQPQFLSGPRAGPPGSQPPFGGPPGAARAAPFSGPPGASQTPFSGPPGAARTPFSGSLGASQPPFARGPPTASQPPFSGAPLMASQPPFSGGPPAVSQPSYAVGPLMGSQPPFAGGQMASQPPSVRGPPPPFAGGQPVGSQSPIAGGSTGATVPFGGMQPSQPFPGQPKTMQQFPGAVPAFQGTPGAGAPFGSPPMWGAQGQQGTQEMPGAFQPPPRMYSMPGQAPIPPMMGQTSLPGSQVSTPSKIDPNQIPRPMASSSILEFETRQGGQANIPPPTASDFIVRDCGNCSPRYMRCTIHQIPCTGDLLSTSGMPLSLLVQPFALPHPSEEPIQVVDFGESGPVRCSRCKGYINPFMKFIDQGRRFICNLCGFTDDTPREYHCNLGPDGRRRDTDERPELCRGTVEFVATKEYMVHGRDPMPAVFFFLIDVSRNALQTGATAAACSAIGQAIADLPEGPRTLVGVATFDSAIHFYNLKRSLQQPLMLIVPDVQDVYTPLQTDLIVPVTECREHLEQLLENIPSMFENNKVAESASGAAMQAAFLAMKPTGGKLLLFQSVLPSIGVGSLSSRETEGRSNISSAEKEVHKLLQPADKTLRTMAIDFAEYQVCVDTFITAQTYVDIASLGVVPKTTGGQVYYYYPFSALSDSAKLYNDLRWNVTRPQGFEAVMRVRCSQGLQVQEYFGNFCKRVPTDIDLPAIDCDKTIMVTFKHEDKFQEGTECAFQCAVLYTTVFGQRRIRVSNLSLPCTSMLSNLFRSADLDSQFASFLKQAANEIPMNPLPQVRDNITNLCIGILHSYRKYCATVSSSGQLILPEALKLLPLYTLALIKSVGLRTDGRLDDRSYWVNRVATLSTTLCVPLVYPRMIAVHDLTSKEDDGSLVPYTVPLSSEHVTDDGVFLMENGEDAFILVGNSVDPTILQQIFGVSSIDAIPSLLVLEQYDNELSKKLTDVVNEIRRQRCSYLRLHVCKKGEPSGMLFFSYMIEDKTPGGLSYVEFLVHVHRQIQTKMA